MSKLNVKGCVKKLRIRLDYFNCSNKFQKLKQLFSYFDFHPRIINLQSLSFIRIYVKSNISILSGLSNKQSTVLNKSEKEAGEQTGKVMMKEIQSVYKDFTRKLDLIITLFFFIQKHYLFLVSI